MAGEAPRRALPSEVRAAWLFIGPGLAIIFLPGAAAPGASPLAGFGWALLAAVATGAGTTVGARNQRVGLPVVAVLGWGAFVGAAASALWAVTTGTRFAVDLSASYVASFLYLASDAMSRYVTGQIIDVNGGQLMP